VILVLLGAVYCILVQWWLHVILWYDELHTYYIAQAPTIARMIEEIKQVDLNGRASSSRWMFDPPMICGLVRASYAIFGVSTVATRLPSVIAFFLASAAVLVFLSRRVGGLWAAAAVVLFWYSPFFRYATEARPYGILLAFFSLTLLSWDSATETPETRLPSPDYRLPSPVSFRLWALAGIAAGNIGMMLSNVLAPLSIMPCCVAEFVRSWRQRRIDWAVWAALLLPLASVVLILPLLQHMGTAIYPTIFRASSEKIVKFYSNAIVWVLPGLLAALVLAFPVAAWRRDASVPWHPFRSREAPLFVAALLPPVLVNLAMMRSGGPFWDRYCITTALIIYVVIVLFVAHECRLNRLAGLAALFGLLGFTLFREVKLLELQTQSSHAHHVTIDQVRPELPFVVNSAVTFLALDHQENAAFLERVYYLVDPQSALRYAHTNLFEGLAGLKQYFPIRAHIESYEDFAAKHSHFLVFGEPEHPEQWLLRKLIAEGAKVDRVGDYVTPYEDSVLYEVTLPLARN
jgi:hypothetical protein